MLNFLLPLAGIATSVVGGIIGGNAKKKAEKANEKSRQEMDAKNMAIQEENSKIPQIFRSEINLSQLVADADKAGLNPLTVIRSGGLAGYAVQHNPQLPKQSLYTSSQLQGASPVAEGLGALGAGLQNFNIGAIQQQALDYKIGQATLQNITADTRARNDMFRAPAWTGTNAVGSGGGFAPASPIPTANTATTRAFGVDWQHNDWFDNAEDIEVRHGELGDLIVVAGPRLISDVAETIGQAGRRFVDKYISPGFMDLGAWMHQQRLVEAASASPTIATPPRGVLDRRWVLDMPGGR